MAAIPPKRNMVIAMAKASSWRKKDMLKETAAPIILLIKLVSDDAVPAIPGNGCKAPATVLVFTNARPNIKIPIGKITAFGVRIAIRAIANIVVPPIKPNITPQATIRLRPSLVTILLPMKVPIR